MFVKAFFGQVTVVRTSQHVSSTKLLERVYFYFSWSYLLQTYGRIWIRFVSFWLFITLLMLKIMKSLSFRREELAAREKILSCFNFSSTIGDCIYKFLLCPNRCSFKQLKFNLKRVRNFSPLGSCLENKGYSESFIYSNKDFLKIGNDLLTFILLSRVFNSFKERGKKVPQFCTVGRKMWAVKCNLKSNLKRTY